MRAEKSKYKSKKRMMYSLDHSRAAQSESSKKRGRVLKVEKTEWRSSALLPAWKQPTPRTRTSHASAMVSSAPGKPHTPRMSPGKPHLCQTALSDDIINISSDAMSITGLDLVSPETDSDDDGLASAENKEVSNSPVKAYISSRLTATDHRLHTIAYYQVRTLYLPSYWQHGQTPRTHPVCCFQQWTQRTTAECPSPQSQQQ